MADYNSPNQCSDSANVPDEPHIDEITPLLRDKKATVVSYVSPDEEACCPSDLTDNHNNVENVPEHAAGVISVLLLGQFYISKPFYFFYVPFKHPKHLNE